LKTPSAEQNLPDRFFPKAEDPFELEPDQRVDGLAEGPERQPVPDLILDGGASCLRAKAVTVDPEPVRSSQLLVDEPVRRLPAGDLGAPVERKAEKAQPVVDQGAGRNPRRRRGEDVKVELRRSDPLEVAGFGEKGDDLVDSEGEGEGGAQDRDQREPDSLFVIMSA
jgi:hypothetical protein